MVGSNAITSWGSVGWFGPLSVAPRLGRRGIADELVEAAHDRLQQRGAAQLLEAVDALAAQNGAPQVVAAVSTANEACTRFVLARGHRVVSQGIAMHRGGAAYRRAEVWAVDDWR